MEHPLASRGRLAATLLLTASPGAYATTDEVGGSTSDPAFRIAFSAYEAEALRIFRASSDPFELMIAATLLDRPDIAPPGSDASDPGGVRAERDALVSHALAAGSDDPAVLWWAVMDCPAATPSICNRDKGLARLQTLEPENAAVWLAALPQKLRGSDGDGGDGRPHDADTVLAHAAASTHHAVHVVSRTKRLFDSFARIVPSEDLRQMIAEEHAPATPTSGAAAVAAMGISLAMTFPGAPVLRTCDARDTPLPAARHKACAALSNTMITASDSHFGQIVGSRIAMFLASTEAEYDAAYADRVAIAWQQDSAGLLQSQLDTTGELLADLMRRWSVPGATEVSATEALLIEHGIALAPPMGWEPSSKGWLGREQDTRRWSSP